MLNVWVKERMKNGDFEKRMKNVRLPEHALNVRFEKN